MGLHEWNKSEIDVCNPDRNGRILKSDHSGRSFDWGFCLSVLSFKQVQGVRAVSILSELKVGETGVLVALDLPESVQNHLMHMGFVPGALVTALRRAPAGDPTVYSIDGMEIALRHETADSIRVRPHGSESEIERIEAAGIVDEELVEASR
jgi:Fe2+ transport system protein FeoA